MGTVYKTMFLWTSKWSVKARPNREIQKEKTQQNDEDEDEDENNPEEDMNQA